jgi:hypothetical protein
MKEKKKGVRGLKGWKDRIKGESSQGRKVAGKKKSKGEIHRARRAGTRRKEEVTRESLRKLAEKD